MTIACIIKTYEHSGGFFLRSSPDKYEKTLWFWIIFGVLWVAGALFGYSMFSNFPVFSGFFMVTAAISSWIVAFLLRTFYEEVESSTILIQFDFSMRISLIVLLN